MKRVREFLYDRGGSYYFRRAVPPEAREAFGGRSEVLVSLRTKSLIDARLLAAMHLAEFERTLSWIKGRPTSGRATVQSVRPLPEDIDAAVRRWLRERLSEPQVVDYWDPERTADGLNRRADLERFSASVQRGMQLGGGGPGLAVEWAAEGLMERERWQIEAGSTLHRHLLRTLGRAQVELARGQGQDLSAEPRTIGDATFSPEQYRLDEARRADRVEPVPIMDLFEGYASERQPAPATVKAWTRQLKAFIAHLGHDDATKITRRDVVAWKEKLLGEPRSNGERRSARTVRDSYLAVLKAVFGWAVENDRLPTNPAERVGMRVPQKTQVREERGLNTAEAITILKATLQPSSGRLTPEMVLARRWVPWVCAYTGARVNEITQLRAEDVTKSGDYWTIWITPEAGSVKNRKPRRVALHSHLVEQGFPDIVKGKSGPIFYNPGRYRGGKAGNPQYKKVGERLAAWVRKLGVSDPEVQPNHGWRHRLSTEGRRHEMLEEVLDYIQGHAPATIGRGYGDTVAEVTSREIEKLPRYRVPGANLPPARKRSRRPTGPSRA